MSQTSVIMFGLLVGFIVFITVRGELVSYLQVLGIAGGGVATTPGGIVISPGAPGGVKIQAY